jgi:AcrR family transcriptional regulator
MCPTDVYQAQVCQTEAPTRAIRKDVARNRALLLQAADEVFAARGPDATLDEIARHAGVGVATAYRHFENKQSLLSALLEARINLFFEILSDAAMIEDPRVAFETYIYKIGELQANDRGMRAAMSSNHGIEKLTAVRDRLQPLAESIVDRAKAAGVLRPEFGVNDVAMMLTMIGTVTDYAGELAPNLWRRYLGFMLDGVLTEGLARHGVNQPSLETGQIESAMRNWNGRTT